MPKKVRELKQMLRKLNFQELPGKGSHTNWIHPDYSGKLTVSGNDGADAKSYQEKDVGDAILEVQQREAEADE